MKDPILEEVWKAKEIASAESKGDMRALVRQIKERAAEIRTLRLKRSQKSPA